MHRFFFSWNSGHHYHLCQVIALFLSEKAMSLPRSFFFLVFSFQNISGVEAPRHEASLPHLLEVQGRSSVSQALSVAPGFTITASNGTLFCTPPV
jgi:hypothetical protein